MPALSQPVTRDETVRLDLITPGGLVVRLDLGHIDSRTRRDLDAGDDLQVVRALGNLTGCRVTVTRTIYSTAGPE